MKRPVDEQAKRWFIQAKDEFEDADKLREMKRFYLALFRFQQAAEKALKAYLYMQLKTFQVFYMHSVSEPVKIAAKQDSAFQSIFSSKKLDQYYIPTRYPNGLPGGVPSRYYDDLEEAKEAMLLAKQVIELTAKKMKL
ncbi:MAG: HEPN domain-containing protein [Candidatus Ranarchaeia archaeon]